MKNKLFFSLVALLFILIGQNVNSAAQIDASKTLKEVDQKKLYWDLYQAIINGDLEQIKKLIKDGADVNASGHNGTPLIAAIVFAGVMEVPTERIIEMVKLLLDAGAKPVLDNFNGEWQLSYALYPLNEAVRKGEEALVELLLDAGSDVNQASHATREPVHKTSLRRAVDIPMPLKIKKQIVQSLLKERPGIELNRRANLETITDALEAVRSDQNMDMANDPDSGEIIKLLENAKKNIEELINRRQAATTEKLKEHLPTVLSKIISQMATSEYEDVPEGTDRQI